VSGYTDDPELVALARAIFSERIPFNGSLGLEVEHIGPDRVSLGFDMEDRFIFGDYLRETIFGYFRTDPVIFDQTLNAPCR
jgi:acyl-coenzyme A thioesterase PaaI-like protein